MQDLLKTCFKIQTTLFELLDARVDAPNSQFSGILNYPRLSRGNDVQGEIQIDAFISTDCLSPPATSFR